MAKARSNKSRYTKKTTRQGSGKFSKTPKAGGERFLEGYRQGSPPSKFRRKKKPGRGQGR